MEIIAFNRHWNFSWRLWVAIFCGIAFLLSLSWWQLRRADEKIQLQARLAERQTSEPLALDILQALPDHEADGLPVRGEARWLAPQVWLLDNQMLDGRPGYDVIIPVQLDRDTQPMLVNLGWVEAPLSRSDLPDVNPPLDFQLQGIVRTSFGGFSLGQNLEDNQHWPMRIERVDTQELSLFTQEPLYSGIVHQKGESPYRIHYQPIVVTPERHRAYAMQWALLALALLIIGFVVSAGARISHKQTKLRNKVVP